MGTNAKSAIYNMLFIKITSSLSYIMTSFIKLMWGWTAYRNSLNRGIQCKINENSRKNSIKETENLLNFV